MLSPICLLFVSLIQKESLFQLLDSSATALRLIATVCTDKPCRGVVAEKLDVRTWAHLSRYFAFKLQAAVALQTFRTGGAAPSQPANQPENQQDAINQLLEAQKEWAQVVAITSSHLGWPSLGGKIFLLDCEGQTPSSVHRGAGTSLSFPLCTELLAPPLTSLRAARADGEGYDRPGPGSTPHSVGMFSWAEMTPYVARDLAIARKG